MDDLFENDKYKIDNVNISLEESLLITIYKPKFNEIINYDYFNTKPKLGCSFLNKIYISTS